MIRTLAVTKDKTLLLDSPLSRLNDADIEWYWVDYDKPSEEEATTLDTFFNFHHLAIEDCLHFLQRPKIDQYDLYHFFVLHSLNQSTLASEEVDIFLGTKYVVSFHNDHSPEIDTVWNRVTSLDKNGVLPKGPLNIFYYVVDYLVDQYFPIVYLIEDRLNDFDSYTQNLSVKTMIDQVFDIRGDLLKLRKTIVPMKDLLYRLLSTDSLPQAKEQRVYFTDIYDHLLKLTEMIESNRDITSDIRDSYLSYNSNRMNSVMMTLTVITTIFMPLTFIAGVYGMNFTHMPELQWRYGYFIVVGIMVVIGISMFLWFRRKGWFEK